MTGRIRAGAVTGAAGLTLALLAAHRPGPLVTGSDDPTAGIVGAAAWAAWALAGYVVFGIGVAAAAHLLARATGPGRLAVVARRTTPALLRRLVETVVGATAAAVVVAGAGPVAAYADPPRPSLDWPGLSVAAATSPHASSPPAVATAPKAPQPVALVSAPPRRHDSSRAELVVRVGDSLWTLAARQLGPGASGAEIAAAWPRLYAANRAVIGTDPDVIHPGQRLVPPAADTRSPR